MYHETPYKINQPRSEVAASAAGAHLVLGGTQAHSAAHRNAATNCRFWAIQNGANYNPVLRAVRLDLCKYFAYVFKSLFISFRLKSVRNTTESLESTLVTKISTHMRTLLI